MIKLLWYYSVRTYVWLGLHIYFEKIDVKGKDNIPHGAVIFAANHQNAFLDALVVACTNTRYGHFLVRADIFKKALARWLLSTLNMMPVYRIRDGWQSLSENQKTFDNCTRIFQKAETILIFPEGNHGKHRRVRPLSKGFTRIAFEALKQNPQLKIYITPVGLNYSHHQKFRSRLNVTYGAPILANDYFRNAATSSSPELRDELSSRLKQLTLHVDNIDQYDEIIQKLESSQIDYLDPVNANIQIAKIARGESLAQGAPRRQTLPLSFLKPLYFAAWLVNALPLSLWRTMERKIKDPVFVASAKFIIGISVFPIAYFTESLMVYLLAGKTAAIVVLIFGFCSMPLLKKNS